jgi:uracil-DNA glycosylase
MSDAPRLHPSWLAAIGEEFDKPYMADLKGFIAAELRGGKTIHPEPEEFFAALDATPLDRVRAVIVGQDPYHGPGQAHGLSFSVRRGVAKPPSLRNIFRELRDDLGVPEPPHGCLAAWAAQGVLMLNAVLSVEDGRPASHAERGWETFTDAVIRAVNDRPGHVAFVLWGAYAQRKGRGVDASRHLVVASRHPSPFSAADGFFGSRPFSKVNAFLRGKGAGEIDWAVPA